MILIFSLLYDFHSYFSIFTLITDNVKERKEGFVLEKNVFKNIYFSILHFVANKILK